MAVGLTACCGVLLSPNCPITPIIKALTYRKIDSYLLFFLTKYEFNINFSVSYLGMQYTVCFLTRYNVSREGISCNYLAWRMWSLGQWSILWQINAKHGGSGSVRHCRGSNISLSAGSEYKDVTKFNFYKYKESLTMNLKQFVT